MKINIASVLKNEGASVKLSGRMELGEFDFSGSQISFEEPVTIEGSVQNIGSTLEISATVKGTYKTQCSRCGSIVTKELGATLFESVGSDFSDVDEECLSLCGNVLDIEGSVRASVFSDIPLKFLCSENCKGLCPKCGINLNEEKCNCDTTVYDPRFAIFRNLQQRGVENGSSKEKNF